MSGKRKSNPAYINAMSKLSISLGYDVREFKELLKSEFSVKPLVRGASDESIENWFGGYQKPRVGLIRRKRKAIVLENKSFFDGKNEHYFEDMMIEFLENLHASKNTQISSESHFIRMEGRENRNSYISVIDNNFLEYILEIGKRENYTPYQFYLAKDREECQWYGILKDWDYIPSIYREVKEATIESFHQNRISTVSAYIIGNGGVGKSVLLRRLAMDLRENENFTVVWISHKTIVDFATTNSIEEIRHIDQKSVLIIIEDWYRVKQFMSALGGAKALFQQLAELPNVRIVVGDRDTDSIIMAKLYALEESVFELTPEENDLIFKKVLHNAPDWKTEETINYELSFIRSTSIFLILWCLGKIHQESSGNKFLITELIRDLSSTIISMVLSDFKKLDKSHSGVAQTLFYCASVYSLYKSPIKLSTFCEIADEFGSHDYQSLNTFVDISTKDILSNYIRIETENDEDVIAFNQDIIAEELIGILNTPPFKFEFNAKLSFANSVVNTGDTSFSTPLYSFVLEDDIKGISSTIKMRFIDEAFRAGFHSTYLIYIFRTKEFSWEIKRDWANKILERYLYDSSGNWSPLVVTTSIKHGDNRIVNEIINTMDVVLINHLIFTALMKSGGENPAKQAATEYLKGIETFESASNQKLATSLIYAEDDLAGEMALKIFNQLPLHRISVSVIEVAFKLVDKNGQTKIFSQLLENPNIYAMDSTLINDTAFAALLRRGDRTLVQQFSTASLRKLESLENTSGNKLAACLKYAEPDLAGNVALEIANQLPLQIINEVLIKAILRLVGEKVQIAICNQLLEYSNFQTLSFDLKIRALKNGDEDLAKTIAIDALKGSKPSDFNYQLFSTLLTISGDKNMSIVVIENYKEHEISPVHSAFRVFSDNLNIPKIVEIKIGEIIDDFFKPEIAKRNEDRYWRYANILKLPFYGVGAWELATKKIIRKWDSLPRELVTSVIIANREHGVEIVENMCKEILHNCKEEIYKQVMSPYTYLEWIRKQSNRNAHHGNHVLLSLGHPNLAKHSKIAAISLSKLNQNSLPESAKEKIANILENEEYPFWNNS